MSQIIQHKKSAVEGKVPTASQLQLGELALNINSNTPMISFKDSNNNIVVFTPKNEVVLSKEEFENLGTIDPNITYYIKEES